MDTHTLTNTGKISLKASDKPRVNPFLWFDSNAEEAVNFYITLFKNSRINYMTHYGEVGAKASGRKKG